MKKLISLLWILLLLTSCNPSSKSDIFEKKKECKRYEKEIINDLCDNCKLWENKVFYSEKTNSCLYEEIITKYNNDIVASEEHRIVDYLNNEELYKATFITWDWDINEKYEKYKERINELKK